MLNKVLLWGGGSFCNYEIFQPQNHLIMLGAEEYEVLVWLTLLGCPTVTFFTSASEYIFVDAWNFLRISKNLLDIKIKKISQNFFLPQPRSQRQSEILNFQTAIEIDQVVWAEILHSNSYLDIGLHNSFRFKWLGWNYLPNVKFPLDGRGVSFVSKRVLISEARSSWWLEKKIIDV